MLIKGKIAKVSPPRFIEFQDHKGGADLYQIGVKTDDGKRILITLNTKDLGWIGKIENSKVFYYQAKSDRIIRTSIRNPEKYIGTTVKVSGLMEPLNEKEKKYRFKSVKEFILYLEE